MTRLDRLVRYGVYRGFQDEGSAPTMSLLAASVDATPHEVRASLERLADAHELVLGPGDPGVWMAHPFSGVPTDYRVRIGERRWYANCAWDGLAILALLGDGCVETVDPVTGSALALSANDGVIDPRGYVYFPVAARRFWDDIGFT